MKLTTASVSGLFGLYDHKLELDPHGVTYVHSTNGMGKSVFLKLVFRLLKGDIEGMTNAPFSRMDIGFDDGSALIVENGDELLVQMQKNELEEKLGAYELQDIIEPVYISPERLTVKRKDGRLMYAVDVYCEELEDRFLAAKEETAIDISSTDPGDDMSDNEIESRLTHLKPKTDFMFNAGLRMNIPVGLRMTPSRYDIGKAHDNYLKLTRAVETFVDDCYGFAESMAVLQDILNSFFVHKKVSIVNGMLTITSDSGKNIPLEVLSSGEKHMIIIFYKLLFQTEPGSLVIIDEPEISIHVSWQQRIGTVFSDLCKLRDLQMIVATHSPQIIHDLWDKANELRG